MIDVESVRADTPGCWDRIHFNNAGASLMPRPVLEAVVQHLELEARIGGYEAADAERERVEDVYRSCARLINSRPDEIALFENATHAWDAAFYALPFQAGDRIVTSRAEYGSNYMAYLQLAHQRDVEIVVIGDDADGQIDLDELRASLDERVKLISLTHVPTSGGLVNPAAEVGAIAREAGVLFLLDACQSIGQMPVDVKEIGCDFLATTGRKFLRGPRGTGFLYIDRQRIAELHPPVAQVGSATWTATNRYTLKKDAKRFETWEASYALRLGLGCAVDYALEQGISAIWERVMLLSDRLRGRLAAIDGVAVHDLGQTKCGIVTFTVDDLPSEQLLAGLRALSINVDISTPEFSRLDFEARGLRPMIRASVHYFNTTDEVDRFGEIVAERSCPPVRAGLRAHGSCAASIGPGYAGQAAEVTPSASPTPPCAPYSRTAGLLLALPDFKIEVYFGRWEFAARFHLTASDAETMTIGELLTLGCGDQLDDPLCSAASASCLPPTAAQQRARATVIFDGVALDNPTAAGIQRFRVTRYLKGDGPRIVRVATGFLRRQDDSITVTSVSLVVHRGERWRIFGRHTATGVVRTTIWDGSRRS